MDLSVAAVVYDAAVPVGVDVAGLDIVRVVHAQCQGRNDDARKGKERNQESHELGLFLLRLIPILC